MTRATPVRTKRGRDRWSGIPSTVQEESNSKITLDGREGEKTAWSPMSARLLTLLTADAETAALLTTVNVGMQRVAHLLHHYTANKCTVQECRPI